MYRRDLATAGFPTRVVARRLPTGVREAGLRDRGRETGISESGPAGHMSLSGSLGLGNSPAAPDAGRLGRSRFAAGALHGPSVCQDDCVGVDAEVR